MTKPTNVSNPPDALPTPEFPIIADVPAFTAARLQMHWAAQALSAWGLTIPDPQPDWSHMAVRYDLDKRVLHTLPAADGARLELDLASATISKRHHGVLEAIFELEGQPHDALMAWAKEQTFQHAAGRPWDERDADNMPDHPVGHGRAYKFDARARAELSAWFDAAAHHLNHLQTDYEHMGPVLCWAHHFDIATLRTLRKKGDTGARDAAITIGTGMTPGDAEHAQPYWYVLPWPVPSTDALPHLVVGTWHTQGWVGAKLDAHQLVAHTAEDLGAFLVGAHQACEQLLLQ